MKDIRFEWDEKKNAANMLKHRISFEEAKTVFYDDGARIIDDPDHSEFEDRFILLGLSMRANMLMVSHCYRLSETVIRIVSARKATTVEAKQYQNYRKG
jgi:uncharacterized DUF497 family protein